MELAQNALQGLDLSNLKLKSELKDTLTSFAEKNGYSISVIEIFSLSSAEQPATAIALRKDGMMKLCYILKMLAQAIQTPTGITEVKIPVILGMPEYFIDESLAKAGLENYLYDVDLSSCFYRISEKDEDIDVLLEKITQILTLQKSQAKQQMKKNFG